MLVGDVNCQATYPVQTCAILAGFLRANLGGEIAQNGKQLLITYSYHSTTKDNSVGWFSIELNHDTISYITISSVILTILFYHQLIDGNSRILKVRYLPYIRPILQGYVRGYTPQIWPFIVQYLLFRILESTVPPF